VFTEAGVEAGLGSLLLALRRALGIVRELLKRSARDRGLACSVVQAVTRR